MCIRDRFNIITHTVFSWDSVYREKRIDIVYRTVKETYEPITIFPVAVRVMQSVVRLLGSGGRRRGWLICRHLFITVDDAINIVHRLSALTRTPLVSATCSHKSPRPLICIVKSLYYPTRKKKKLPEGLHGMPVGHACPEIATYLEFLKRNPPF